jgi:hypothetical protein
LGAPQDSLSTNDISGVELPDGDLSCPDGCASELRAEAGQISCRLDELFAIGRDDKRQPKLTQIAELYATKHDWRVTIRDGCFYAEGRPTAGPSPHDEYELAPKRAHSFGTEENLNATRWRF